MVAVVRSETPRRRASLLHYRSDALRGVVVPLPAGGSQEAPVDETVIEDDGQPVAELESKQSALASQARSAISPGEP